MEQSTLCDDLGRKVSYLRLSITDRCNLRCQYCQSNCLRRFIPHEEILTYEEILRVVRILTQLGVRKVRLTGGEPLVRKGCLEFLGHLRKNFPDLDLRLTSNGTLLADALPSLVQHKINGVNISLDTFDPKTFAQITGRDLLPRVLASIEALVCAGLKVKVNAVLLPKVTQASLEQFVALAQKLDIDVRFIEFMPIGQDTRWSSQEFCSVSEILELLLRKYALVADDSNDPTAGPARMFKFSNGCGRLGFISPLSNHFCDRCNRLRLTSEGCLRLCLYADQEYPLRPLLREGAKDSEIAATIQKVLLQKPLGVNLLAKRSANKPVAIRSMSGIGG